LPAFNVDEIDIQILGRRRRLDETEAEQNNS